MSNRPFKIVQGFSLGLNLASLAWGIVLGTQYLNYNKLCAYFLWRDIHFQAAPALAAQPLNTNIILSLPIKFKPNQFLCFFIAIRHSSNPHPHKFQVCSRSILDYLVVVFCSSGFKFDIQVGTSSIRDYLVVGYVQFQ